jgi:sialidase-1
MKISFLIIIAVITILNNGYAQDYALLYDGNNDYVDMGGIDDFNIEPGESFTFCAWFKLNALPLYQRLVCKRDGGNPGYEIWFNDEGKLAVNIRTTAMADMSYWSNSYADDLNWHFVGFVIDAENNISSIYFDGFLSSENSGDALETGVSNNSNFVLGTRSTLSNYLNGVMDEVSVWKRALSETEIQDVMNGNLTGNEPNLTGYWRFDDQAITATDYSLNNYFGTIHGCQYVTNDNQYFTDMSYISSECDQDDMVFPAGRSNIDETILRLQIQTEGALNPFQVNSVTVNLNGTTDLNDLDSVRLIYTRISQGFSYNYQVRYPAKSPNAGEITFDISQPLFHGNNYFWIVGDIAGDAAEGNLLDVECINFTIDGSQAGTYIPQVASPPGNKSIILAHKTLFASGTEGIHTFRIPAMITTNEGTLIAATDARVDNGADLGWTGNIDIVYKRSTDQGITWSDMITAADFPGVEGASDCSIIFDNETNEIVMFFNYADETDDFQWPFMIKSGNDGLSWTPFVNLKDEIYDPNWGWAFVTSGRGIQKSDGGLRHVINVMEGNTPGALIFGSDDHGETWYSIKNPVSSLANESKLVQLDDGSLMINCRQENSSKRMIGQTDDDGNTWYNVHYDNTLIEPKCNASFIRYTSVLDGFSKSRLLFSNPASSSSRSNMKVRLSYDEGETWTSGKVINPGSSAYSSLSILDDNTIGLLYEANNYKEIRFARFSLDWLTDGQDSIQFPVGINEHINDNGILIYPNPARDLITIDFKFQSDEQIVIDIIDLAGKLMIRKVLDQLNIDAVSIPVDSLSSGTYSVVVRFESRVYSKKIIISK